MKDEENLITAIDFLKKGELVAIPTETVYGLAANAFDADAVAKIFEAKNRPTFDPLIVHTYSIEQAKTFVKYFPEKAEILANKFWAGALTLLLPKKDIIPDLVTAGLETVAVRIPNHTLTLELLRQLDFPLAAPSANPFGYISPTTAQHVRNQLGNKIAYILDGGASKIGIESTIVGFENDEITIYRLGGVSVEAIEALVGNVNVNTHSTSNPNAPGMLASHYAPRKPFLVGKFEDLLREFAHLKVNQIAVLAFGAYLKEIPLENQFNLSPQKDLKEAAQNLFAGMRTLDNLDVEVIFAELLPEEGLGRAINDRLRRASVR